MAIVAHTLVDLVKNLQSFGGIIVVRCLFKLTKLKMTVFLALLIEKLCTLAHGEKFLSKCCFLMAMCSNVFLKPWQSKCMKKIYDSYSFP